MTGKPKTTCVRNWRNSHDSVNRRSSHQYLHFRRPVYQDLTPRIKRGPLAKRYAKSRTSAVPTPLEGAFMFDTAVFKKDARESG
jgi:hypothetical protein